MLWITFQIDYHLSILEETNFLIFCYNISSSIVVVVDGWIYSFLASEFFLRSSRVSIFEIVTNMIRFEIVLISSNLQQFWLNITEIAYLCWLDCFGGLILAEVMILWISILLFEKLKNFERIIFHSFINCLPVFNDKRVFLLAVSTNQKLNYTNTDPFMFGFV